MPYTKGEKKDSYPLSFKRPWSDLLHTTSQLICIKLHCPISHASSSSSRFHLPNKTHKYNINKTYKSDVNPKWVVGEFSLPPWSKFSVENIGVLF